MRWTVVLLGLCGFLGAGAWAELQAAAPTRAREPVVGLPCEGCEAVFEGLSANIASISRIAPRGEPGQAMRIEGTVLDQDARPAAGVIVYAYHTNARGIYPTDARMKGRAAHRHGKLRGWARTDEEGRYRFDTVRPAGYPGTDIPSHVHMHVIEVGLCTYYIDDIVFEDDPRLTREKREALNEGRGGAGVVVPRRDESGVWRMTRDIVLGRRIPGHPKDAQH